MPEMTSIKIPSIIYDLDSHFEVGALVHIAVGNDFEILTLRDLQIALGFAH
jgi:hypothetical protein